MEVQSILFLLLAFFIVSCSILTVTTKRIIRAATYLLFVLFGTAGLYFLLGYTFLGAVQVMVYAGGIVILYVFSIFLTSKDQFDEEEKKPFLKTSNQLVVPLLTSLVGLALVCFIIFKNQFVESIEKLPIEETYNIKTLGLSMLSTAKYGYMLPFEVVSVLLLACIVAGILIARKR